MGSFGPGCLQIRWNIRYDLQWLKAGAMPKGYGQGVDNGVRLAMGIILLALLDKCHIERDDIEAAWEDVIRMSDSVKKHYLSP